MKFCMFSTLVVLITFCCYATNGKLSITKNEQRREQEQEQQQQQQQQEQLSGHQQQQQQQHAHEKTIPQRNLAYHPLNVLPLFEGTHSWPNNALVESRQKRSQHEFSDYRDWNQLIEEMQDNSPLQNGNGLSSEFDVENISPLAYCLLLQKIKELQSNEPIYRVRTPRLGRSIDFQQLLEDGDIDSDEAFFNREQQFLAQLMKKSVPFKPRLGKRGPRCN